jgi:hypothetical protein
LVLAVVFCMFLQALKLRAARHAAVITRFFIV